MAWRVLALVAFLGVHSSMGALAGLLHLCRGEVRLLASCCCHRHAAAAPASADADLGVKKAGLVRCCETQAVQPASGTAVLKASSSRWELPPQALPPSLPVLAPPAPESLPEAWVRGEGLRRATAPPLYIQHCAYLI